MIAASSRDVRASCRVCTFVATPKCWLRVCNAITISSSEAFPARSPMPLIVHSTCRAPARTPASEFATARPRSSWQCVEITTEAAPGTVAMIPAIIAKYSSGIT